MVEWLRALPAALEQAQRERKPVMVYIWKEG